ncbi:MAG: hypothetical protein K2G07_07030 [Muribaculaceae bacterium]|nr:hypothetical protein [Muribaculaceae bacterium]
MAGILLLFLIVFAVGCTEAYQNHELPTKAPKRRRRLRRLEKEKPYGLPWMGGTMRPKKKDYFED